MDTGCLRSGESRRGVEGSVRYGCLCKQAKDGRAHDYVCTSAARRVKGEGMTTAGRPGPYGPQQPPASHLTSVVAAGALPPLQTRPTSNSHQHGAGLRRSTWITVSCRASRHNNISPHALLALRLAPSRRCCCLVLDTANSCSLLTFACPECPPTACFRSLCTCRTISGA